MFEIAACAELGVEIAVVDDGIVTAERALACEFADRLNGHNPNDIDAQFFQGGQLCLCRGESTFGCKLAGVQFVDSGIVRPVGVAKSGLLGAR